MAHPGGRPSMYNPSMNDQVIKLCRLGATDKEIADFFNTTETTINNWKLKEPEFLESLKEGKIQSDLKVASSLYGKAINGDVTAIIYWLKNRRSKDWRDRKEIEHTILDKDEILKKIREVAQDG